MVGVVATDDTCTTDRTTVASGDIEFAVTNRGTVVTEVYLYAPYDQVIGEVENVEPGDTGSFAVTVGGGAYEVACKPGQTGDGIRTAFQFSGDLDPRQTTPPDPATARGVAAFSIEVKVTADRFAGELDDLVVVEGQTITFRVHNAAPDVRGFAVLGPDGFTTVGRTGDIPPGGAADVSVAFSATGTYTAIDPVGDHRARGSEVTFRVID